MQGLLYPAMLGTFFVALFQNIQTKNAWTFSFDFFLYFVMIIYFIISFTINQTLSKLKIYNSLTFISDIAEIVLMFFLFSIISYDNIDNPTNKYSSFYLLSSGIPVAQTFWNISLAETRKIFWILNCIYFVISLLFGFWLYQFLVARVIFLSVTVIMISYYFYALVIDEKQFND